MTYEEAMKRAEKYQKEVVDPAIEELKKIIQLSKEREEKIMLIPTTCPICGETNYISVKSEDWYAYVNGALVQKAFPYLSADEREMLISGICPTCWDKMFGED